MVRNSAMEISIKIDGDIVLLLFQTDELFAFLRIVNMIIGAMFFRGCFYRFLIRWARDLWSIKYHCIYREIYDTRNNVLAK